MTDDDTLTRPYYPPDDRPEDRRRVPADFCYQCGLPHAAETGWGDAYPHMRPEPLTLRGAARSELWAARERLGLREPYEQRDYAADVTLALAAEAADQAAIWAR